MLKNLQRTGSVTWDRTVREYVNKLPLPDSAKSTLKKYLGYQMVMGVLDVVIDFSGTIEDGIICTNSKNRLSSMVSRYGSKSVSWVTIIKKLYWMMT